METPEEDLYCITGEEGLDLASVKAALDCLLSPRTNNIGEKLLRRAYALHGRPLEICVTGLVSTGNYNDGVHHAVVINPDELKTYRFIAEDGTAFSPSLEVVLAHEMDHASREIPQNIKDKYSVSEKRAKEARKPPAKLKAHIQVAKSSMFQSITNLAIHGIMGYTNEETDQLHTFFKSDVDRCAWVEAYEVPAVATENQVATMLGQKKRLNYYDTFMDYSASQSALIQGLQSFYNVSDKARFNEMKRHITPKGYWQNRVSDSEIHLDTEKLPAR